MVAVLGLSVGRYSGINNHSILILSLILWSANISWYFTKVLVLAIPTTPFFGRYFQFENPKYHPIWKPKTSSILKTQSIIITSTLGIGPALIDKVKNLKIFRTVFSHFGNYNVLTQLKSDKASLTLKPLFGQTSSTRFLVGTTTKIAKVWFPRNLEYYDHELTGTSICGKTSFWAFFGISTT